MQYRVEAEREDGLTWNSAYYDNVDDALEKAEYLHRRDFCVTVLTSEGSIYCEYEV